MADKIGFIGLGIMGKPMAQNLLKAGYSLVVYDVRQEPVERVAKDGATKANSPVDVAGQAEVIITMLPDGPEVEEVVCGPKGILEGIGSGAIVVDMSSIAPPVTLRIGKLLRKKGVHFLDAPVSGGEPGAVAGTSFIT